jgi:hypothetical protein
MGSDCFSEGFRCLRASQACKDVDEDGLGDDFRLIGAVFGNFLMSA